MLDKKDIKTIQDIVTDSLAEFLEKGLGPYLDQITGRLEHLENDDDTFLRKLEVNELQHGEILKKLEDIETDVKDHWKRIKRLETATLA